MYGTRRGGEYCLRCDHYRLSSSLRTRYRFSDEMAGIADEPSNGLLAHKVVARP
jgi:hypothetical protein